VSHAPERREKNCLNCGATVIGRFCHVCGQENVVPKESFWNLVIHFFYDITHFDSKFFDSLKYLLFRPGFLSKEYTRGRRASYLHPVRMYVFTSAIFFLMLFVLYNPQKAVLIRDEPLTHQERMQKAADLEQELKTAEGDSSILIKEVRLLKDTSKPVTELDLLKTAGKGMFGQSGKRYNTIAEYDSVQHALPPDKRDGWFMHAMTKKQIQLNAKYKGDPNEVSTNFLEIFLHKLPYLLFISLPLFALTLALLYFRRRRQFFYTDHAVFSIHHYIFSFILLLCIFLLGAAKKTPGFHWLRVIEVILIFVWPIHLYIAMLNFYNQGWFKTFLKFFLLNIIALVSLLILFVGFLLLSIFQL
jgi:Protein of unknown function (DUF3667)